MKKKGKIFLKTVIICAWCFTILIGVGYYFVDREYVQTEIKQRHIPFRRDAPESKGVLIDIDKEQFYVYLDFSSDKILLSINPKQQDKLVYGYPVDYKMSTKRDFLIDLVDYLGGIEIELASEKLRYTGNQIEEILEKNSDEPIKRTIAEAVCQKISEEGVSVSLFTKVLKYSKTDFKLVDCYSWIEYMDNICKNLQIID